MSARRLFRLLGPCVSTKPSNQLIHSEVGSCYICARPKETKTILKCLPPLSSPPLPPILLFHPSSSTSSSTCNSMVLCSGSNTKQALLTHHIRVSKKKA